MPQRLTGLRAREKFHGSLGNVEGFGYYKDDIGYLSGSFEGFINVQTPDASRRSSLGVEANITVYGVVGTDGFGKIFDRTYDKYDINSNYVSLNFADRYSGIGVVIYYTYRGFVDGNSFRLD